MLKDKESVDGRNIPLCSTYIVSVCPLKSRSTNLSFKDRQGYTGYLKKSLILTADFACYLMFYDSKAVSSVPSSHTGTERVFSCLVDEANHDWLIGRRSSKILAF